MAKRRLDHILVYNTTKWRKLRKLKLSENPICECCNREFSHHVHHIREILEDRDREGILKRGFDYDNLSAVCEECHRNIHEMKKYSSFEVELLELDQTVWGKYVAKNGGFKDHKDH